MEKLFERHDEYLNTVPVDFIRNFMYTINWDSRLICIKGPKGVGKSTLILQKIKRDFADGDRHVLYCSVLMVTDMCYIAQQIPAIFPHTLWPILPTGL